MSTDNVNSNTVGSTSQYFIELDSDGNMRIVSISLSYSTTTEKYNLAKSEEKEYTYYIKSNNKFVIKENNRTATYDISINDSMDVITFHGPEQTGNAQIVSKYEKVS